jgi:molybdopterin converting factor small subunit
MIIVKFFGSLRELFGDNKLIRNEEELKEIVNEIKIKKSCSNEDIKILLNGKTNSDVPIKDGDKVSVFYFGGKGFPGG